MDQSLINGCIRKDARDQKLLFTTYAPVMLGVCRRYVNDPDTAQDILQEGFIKLFACIGTFRGEGSFAGWIRRIFVTTVLEYLRQNNALKLTVPLEECSYMADDIPRLL